MYRSLRAMLALFALAVMAPLSSPAHALLPAADNAEAPAETVDQAIETSPDIGDDERIEERIEGIFAELPVFENVTVAVSEGVVALEGTVGDGDAIERAANIAGRVSGVVTVENSIERDLSVEENLSVFSRLTGFVEDAIEALPLIGVALLTAILIGMLGYFIAGFTSFWNRVAPNIFLGELIRSAIRFVFVVGGLVIALDMIGAGALLGAVLGGAGVIGLALGFAMRDTVENYVASLMLSLRQPFRANDHVVIDDKEGRVIRLTSRATVLMTLDGNHLRIPNSQVFKAIILNYTRNPQRRFEFELGVDADDDAMAARKTGREALESLDFVLDDPAPEVRINQVGDSNVVLRFLGWIDQGEAGWHKARTRAIAKAKTALEDAGFALPEPIYRLRFDSRTDPLPFANIGEEEAAKRASASRPATAPSAGSTRSAADQSAQTEQEDIAPDDEVARMVDAERASEPGEKDLLDDGRPVE